jgi:DNA-binding transcriptional ArsR family regulator
MYQPPGYYDLERDVVLTPKQLRGLVHPIRLRLLHMLRDDGPSTASRLAERIGQSSGVTSYHLRLLAKMGFIAEDTERGTGRDRWWRAMFRWMDFTFRDPSDPGDPETIELAQQFARTVASASFERMLRYIDSLDVRADQLPTLPWTLANTPLRLTPAQARELAEQVSDLVAAFRREPEDPEPAPGTVRAVFQFQMLPDDPAGGPAGEQP